MVEICEVVRLSNGVDLSCMINDDIVTGTNYNQSLSAPRSVQDAAVVGDGDNLKDERVEGSE